MLFISENTGLKSRWLYPFKSMISHVPFPQLTKVRDSRRLSLYKLTAIASLYFKFYPNGHSLCSPQLKNRETKLMPVIQTQALGTNSIKSPVFREWCILINHEYAHVEEFHQNNSWFKIKEMTLDFHAEVRRFHSHVQCSDMRNLETDTSDSWGKAKQAFLGWPVIWGVWCQLSPPGGWGEPILQIQLVDG